MLRFATFFLLLVAAPAAAQQRFDPQFFHPPPTQRSNAPGTWSADILGHTAFEAGLLFHYDDSPLMLRTADGDRLYGIVGRQASLHVMGGIGLFDRLELGLDIPILLTQDGDAIPTLPNFDVNASGAGAGVGDIRFAAKVQLFDTDTEEHPGGAAMALVLETFFPTGDRESFQGDGWRVAPRLAFDGITTGGHRITFMLGYTYRERTEVGSMDPSLSVGPTFDWAFAPQFRTQYVHVIPAIRGALVTGAENLGVEEVPVEAGLTLRALPIEPLMIQAGGSVGLNQGFGVPDYRILFGVSWLQDVPDDTDGDGILDPDDQCPEEPEDRDDFEDEDGCPDPDNDGDGVLDDPDECPLRAEDQDGFEDGDGCPDPDNDADGILDEPDQCPDEAEDHDGFEDADGCPDPDNDGDGVLDEPDQCPIMAEDLDEFEDEDGCPDPDNDGDGILDEPDQCPNEAEDRNGVDDEDGCPEVDTDGDGLLDPVDQCPEEAEDFDRFEDENGCPDPDNDGDGILDEPDQCPNEAEVVNGFEDEDGCPDEGAIRVTCRAIEINDRIYFETGKAIIRRRSHGLLDQLAAVMGSRPDIRKVRVEGHTDSRGRDRYNMELSHERAAAVREYLVSRGISGDRLISQGFGETQPIESNSTRAGRAANRRVEFVILEQEGCQEEAAQAAGATSP